MQNLARGLFIGALGTVGSMMIALIVIFILALIMPNFENFGVFVGVAIFLFLSAVSWISAFNNSEAEEAAKIQEIIAEYDALTAKSANEHVIEPHKANLNELNIDQHMMWMLNKEDIDLDFLFAQWEKEYDETTAITAEIELSSDETDGQEIRIYNLKRILQKYDDEFEKSLKEEE